VNVRGVTAALVALAAIGMLRIVWLHFVSEPLHQKRRTPIDARYAELHRWLPEGQAGYVSDLPAGLRLGEDATGEGTRLYLHAQYALAPVLLRYGDAHAPAVVANVADPSKLSEVLRQHGLELVRETGPGVALARPR
jgi:hypothetical protein